MKPIRIQAFPPLTQLEYARHALDTAAHNVIHGDVAARRDLVEWAREVDRLTETGRGRRSRKGRRRA